MSQQRKDNSGALFKNDRKQTENHPDYTGQAVINGVEYWISAWINKSNSGIKYMALSLNQKEQIEEAFRESIKKELQDPIFDDDIPF
jgi:uncharacterized protein (DUF736 family)